MTKRVLVDYINDLKVLKHSTMQAGRQQQVLNYFHDFSETTIATFISILNMISLLQKLI